MRGAERITTLFLDVGGVLLTDGWDHHARRRAAKTFTLDWAEMEERHLLNFATYEAGKLTLEEYLARVVFYQMPICSLMGPPFLQGHGTREARQNDLWIRCRFLVALSTSTGSYPQGLGAVSVFLH